MIQDFYAILGVAPDADPGQITHAFRRLIRVLHPDTPTAADADSERFTQVVAAWRVLHDPVKRAAYDRTRPQATPTIRDSPTSVHEHHASEGYRDDAVLVAGPTIIHARPVPQSGPVIRAGPPVRLGD